VWGVDGDGSLGEHRLEVGEPAHVVEVVVREEEVDLRAALHERAPRRRDEAAQAGAGVEHEQSMVVLDGETCRLARFRGDPPLGTEQRDTHVKTLPPTACDFLAATVQQP
jgi:hypothetical protein